VQFVTLAHLQNHTLQLYKPDSPVFQDGVLVLPIFAVSPNRHKKMEKEKETFASEIMCQRILCKILRLANQQRKVDEKMRSTHWPH
jgi:thiamine kinase-like enzyme